MNSELGFLVKGTVINYSYYLINEQVKAKATEIAQSTRSSRSYDEVYADALNGLALEAAVLSYLRTTNIDATESSDLVYDMIVVFEGIEYLIDIKGRFKPHARTYTQSAWEQKTLVEKNLNIYYLCFNCTDGVNARFEGYALSGDFASSIKYTGYYIYSDQLR